MAPFGNAIIQCSDTTIGYYSIYIYLFNYLYCNKKIYLFFVVINNKCKSKYNIYYINLKISTRNNIRKNKIISQKSIILKF